MVRRNRDFADRVNEFGRAGVNDEARRREEQEPIRRATRGGEITISRDGRGIKLPGT